MRNDETKYKIKIIHELTPENIQDADYVIMYLNHVRKIYNMKTGKTKIILIHADHLSFHSPSDQYLMTTYVNQINPEHAKIWEYNPSNIVSYWQNMPSVRYTFLPPEYSPFLEFVYKNVKHIPYHEKDIDVLLLGIGYKRRAELMYKLSKKCRAFIVSNITDVSEYCELAERAKIVLNIHSPNNMDVNKPYDYYRLSLLYANRIFVINEDFVLNETYQSYMSEFINSLITIKYEEIESKIDDYLKLSSDEIDKITQNTYQLFKKCSQMETKVIREFDSVKYCVSED